MQQPPPTFRHDPFVRLPVELRLRISELGRQDDWRLPTTLLYTSHAWFEALAPELWRTIDLDIPNLVTTSELLSRRPELAAYVRRINIRLDTVPPDVWMLFIWDHLDTPLPREVPSRLERVFLDRRKLVKIPPKMAPDHVAQAGRCSSSADVDVEDPYDSRCPQCWFAVHRPECLPYTYPRDFYDVDALAATHEGGTAGLNVETRHFRTTDGPWGEGAVKGCETVQLFEERVLGVIRACQQLQTFAWYGPIGAPSTQLCLELASCPALRCLGLLGLSPDTDYSCMYPVLKTIECLALESRAEEFKEEPWQEQRSDDDDDHSFDDSVQHSRALAARMCDVMSHCPSLKHLFVGPGGSADYEMDRGVFSSKRLTTLFATLHSLRPDLDAGRTEEFHHEEERLFQRHLALRALRSHLRETAPGTSLTAHAVFQLVSAEEDLEPLRADVDDELAVSIAAAWNKRADKGRAEAWPRGPVFEFLPNRD